MLIYHSTHFEEFPYGSYLAHLYRFSIDEFRFVVIFSPIDLADSIYHAFRSEEVGFLIPAGCFDVKFDREENFDDGTYYLPPQRGKSAKSMVFSKKLAEALETVILRHLVTYEARAYFAVAENDKLRRFYDRILQASCDKLVFTPETGLGEGGMGYVLKTRYF